MNSVVLETYATPDVEHQLQRQVEPLRLRWTLRRAAPLDGQGEFLLRMLIVASNERICRRFFSSQHVAEVSPKSNANTPSNSQSTRHWKIRTMSSMYDDVKRHLEQHVAAKPSVHRCAHVEVHDELVGVRLWNAHFLGRVGNRRNSRHSLRQKSTRH